VAKEARVVAKRGASAGVLKALRPLKAGPIGGGDAIAAVDGPDLRRLSSGREEDGSGRFRRAEPWAAFATTIASAWAAAEAEATPPSSSWSRICCWSWCCRFGAGPICHASSASSRLRAARVRDPREAEDSTRRRRDALGGASTDDSAARFAGRRDERRAGFGAAAEAEAEADVELIAPDFQNVP